MKLKKASIFIKIVIAALIIYGALSLSGIQSQIDSAEAQRAQLQERVDAALYKNAELEYDIAHASDDETIEEVARMKLGLVKPGEKIFYDVSN